MINNKLSKAYKNVFEKSSSKVKKKIKSFQTLQDKNKFNFDLWISKAVKEEIDSEEILTNFKFLSEEEEKKPFSLSSPIIVLDPMDGSKAFAQGLSECCLALSFVHEDGSSHYVWNFNNDSIWSLEGHDYKKKVNYDYGLGEALRPLGLISRTDERRFRKHSSLTPMSSIALKLAFLSSGDCDFVISKTPKSIWDIYAGTYLCWSQGFSLYQKDKEVKELNSILIDGPLIWCKPNNFEEVRKLAL